jgi:DnaJ-class molecular chaperone
MRPIIRARRMNDDPEAVAFLMSIGNRRVCPECEGTGFLMGYMLTPLGPLPLVAPCPHCFGGWVYWNDFN